MKLNITSRDLQRISDTRGLARQDVERALKVVTSGKHLVITSRSLERGLALAEGLCSLASRGGANAGNLVIRGEQAPGISLNDVAAISLIDQTWLVITGADAPAITETQTRFGRKLDSWRAILIARRSARGLVDDLGEEIFDTFGFITIVAAAER